MYICIYILYKCIFKVDEGVTFRRTDLSTRIALVYTTVKS